MPLFLGQEKISQVIVSVENSDGGVNTNDATLTSGEQMLSGITAYSNGKKYTGTIATVNGPSPSISMSNDGTITASVSNPKGYQPSATTKTTTYQLNTKGAATITPSTSVQTAIASGTYATGDITVSAMPTGALSTPTINESTGLVTAGVSSSGYLDTSKTSTLQLTTKTAEIFTPTTTNQTINAGQYLTGAQTIQGDANLVPENIASGVSIFGVTGTHQGGSGTDISDTTATEADIVNGKTAYINGGKVTGTLVVQNYYTGSTVPESSFGNDGDLYFKV